MEIWFVNDLTNTDTSPDVDSMDSSIHNELINENGGSVSVSMNDTDQVDSHYDEEKDTDAVHSKSDADNQDSETDSKSESESVNSDSDGIQLSKHLNQHGRLDNEAIKYLTNQGYSTNEIRQKEKELHSIQTDYVRQFIDRYGSMDAAKRVSEFFIENYSEEQVNLFKEAVDSDDIGRVMSYLDFAKSDMLNKQVNDEPNTTSTGAAHAVSAGAFKSQQEILEAMRDNRFLVGTDYYKDVRKRLHATDKNLVLQVPCYF